MRTTEELIERISPRYKNVRNQKMEILWEDFLNSVEKAIGKISDEVFAATDSITIFYITKKGDKNVYRSKVAGCSSLQGQLVEYEEDDILLGTREMLEIAFEDFKSRAKKDSNICTDWFELDQIKAGETGERKVPLDFLLPKEL